LIDEFFRVSPLYERLQYKTQEMNGGQFIRHALDYKSLIAQ